MQYFLLFFLFMISCVSCARQPVVQEETLTESNILGVKVRAKKAFSVETPNAGTIVFYTVIATNVPPHRKFTLQMSDTANIDTSFVIKLISDNDGRLWVKKDNRPLDRYPLPISHVLPGEVSSWWLVAEDRSVVVGVKMIGYPLETFGSDGAQISLTRLHNDGSLVCCNGNFFKAKEVVHVSLSSKNKTIHETVTCAGGSFALDLLPPDSSSFSDILTLNIKRANGEILTLNYPYGRESFNRGLWHGNLSKIESTDEEAVGKAILKYYSPGIESEVM